MIALALVAAINLPISPPNYDIMVLHCQNELNIDLDIIRQQAQGLDPLKMFEHTDYYYEAVELVETPTDKQGIYIIKKYEGCLQGFHETPIQISTL